MYWTFAPVPPISMLGRCVSCTWFEVVPPEIISQLLYRPVSNIDIGGTGARISMRGMFTITSDTLVSEAIVVVAKFLPSTVWKFEKMCFYFGCFHEVLALGILICTCLAANRILGVLIAFPPERLSLYGSVLLRSMRVCVLRRQDGRTHDTLRIRLSMCMWWDDVLSVNSILCVLTSLAVFRTGVKMVGYIMHSALALARVCEAFDHICCFSYIQWRLADS